MKPCSLYRRLELVETNLSAWRALKAFHYRPGSPGAVSKVFALRLRKDIQRGGALLCEAQKSARTKQAPLCCAVGWHPVYVGVIVYVMPTLNSRMRDRVTGGRYHTANNPAVIERLNRDFRRIARVVIHPAWRGIGLGRLLVRETLDKAGTSYVEASAAMGAVHPFFEQAGMTRHDPPAEEAYRSRYFSVRPIYYLWQRKGGRMKDEGGRMKGDKDIRDRGRHKA